MGLFSKFFKTSNTKQSSKEQEINKEPVVLSLDDLFVNNFINKGGKFLYCLNHNEVVETFKNILAENTWQAVSCNNSKLKSICETAKVRTTKTYDKQPFLTTCEHLVADSGNIMLSSNQLGENRLANLNTNFIIVASTSQIVKNMGEGLTGIKNNCKDKIPTNICDIRNYKVNTKNDNFLDYGTSNTKNLYLILVEDL